MNNIAEKLADTTQLIEQLKRDYPTETNAFLSLTARAEAGKALSIKEKELINVALSVAGQCEWCIAIHVKHALAVGASRDELVEAGFMAVIMHGGPALMYLTPLLQAVDEFSLQGIED